MGGERVRLVYGALLRLYPAEFRRLYGEEMRDAFVELHRRVAASRGAGGLAVLWLRTLVDAAFSGVRERLSRRGYRVNLRSDLRFPRGGLATLAADASQDVRFAVRTLAAAPGFTLVVVLTLGLGIGANTAVYSMVYGILVKPLPFGGGGSVVHVRQAAGTDPLRFSVHDIEDFRQGTRGALTEVAEYHSMSFALTGQGEPDLVRTGVVSHNFFDLLQVTPALGREFVRAEDEPGADPVLVLSDGYWRSRFHADPSVVGSQVTMNGQAHTIVGVLPPYPQFPAENDVYMPVANCPYRSADAFIADRESRMMSLYGRLRPEATLAEAETEVRRTGAALAARHPEAYPEQGYHADLELVRDELVQGARSPLTLLLGVAGFVLLIACANAANLALSRAGRRRSELTVRSALGAGRGRLARQLLTENVLLALAGGGVGLLLAYGGMDLLVAYAARFTRRAPEVAMDAPVLLFTLLVSVATGLLFGTAPAAAERRSMATTINAVGSTLGRRGRRLQSVLVVVQVSVAFAVLSGAALMLRSVWALQQVDPGVDTEQVLSFRLALEEPRYATLEQGNAFFREAQRRLREVPGVVAVSRTMSVPLAPPMDHGAAFLEEDLATLLARAEYRTVGADYFRVMGVRVVEGRGLTEADSLGTPFVAVVNRRFAREAFPGESPVGKRMVQCFPDECNPPMTIVGVVEDIRHNGPESEVALEVYRSGLQVDWGGAYMVLRTDGPTEEVAPVLAQAIHSLDPDVPVTELRNLEGLRSEHVAPRRLTAVLLLIFALVAVGLSLAGIFGVLTLAVSARQREMGIRRAMGARESVVRTLVVREGLLLVGLGLAVGLVLATAMGMAMGNLLWGVEPRDPATYGGVAALFVGVAFLACWLPARRASRTDVVDTLRST